MKDFEDNYIRAIGENGVRGLGDPQVKKELEDRIYRLKEALATASDEEARHEIQFLLDRAKGEYQRYIVAEKRMVEMIRRDMHIRKKQEEDRRRKLYIIASSLAGVALVVLFVVLHINASNRAAEIEATAKAAFQDKSDKQKETQSTEDSKLGDDELFPKNLIGKWSGTMGASETSITFSEDGAVTIQITNSDGSYNIISGAVTSTVAVDDTTFRIVDYSGTVYPVQLGGIYTGYDFGYKLSPDGKSLYPILWQYQYGQTPDYSQYTYDENNPYTKTDE
ncbi:hypothetical protein ACVR0S_08290 [Streptococcus dentapri]|uniref:Uncharacterized protein n=1 Tax=Streptococcus dentapri TaxID=573564 RepID=A0ABV8D0L2_9STRE